MFAVWWMLSYLYVYSFSKNYESTKPEPNLLKILPIIPSSTSQKIYPLFLFYSHIIVCYSYIIVYALLFR